MPTRSSPLVTAAELEALIARSGPANADPVDRFYPLRVWFLILMTSGYALVLLLFPYTIAGWIPQENLQPQMTRYFYLRGWGQLLALVLGLYAYLRSWYPGLIFGGMGLVAFSMLLVDLVIVYPPFLARPTPMFTILFALRILGIACLFLNMLNCQRLPPAGQRLHPWRSLHPSPSQGED